MKKLLLILLFILISCNITPEQKAVREIKKQDFIHVNIKSVQITDTIFLNEVDSVITIDLIYTDTLKKQIARLRNKSRSISPKLQKSNVDMIRRYENILDQRMTKLRKYEEIYYEGVDTTICGYHVMLITDRDTLEVVVKKDFKPLCPALMLSDEITERRHRRSSRPQRNFNKHLTD